MTRHDDRVGLRHMLDHAVEAVSMAEGRTPDDLDHDRQFSLAVLKLVEIIGEAANRVSLATQVAHPDIPWSRIVATRNRLIHGYDRVDHVVLWDIVTLDLPPLISQLGSILPDQSGPES